MGKGYAKTLSSLNIPFDYYDPPLGKDKFTNFTHALITTPIKTHYESYNLIKNYINDEKIMIIKPVVFLPEEISLLDKNIFFGMPERYNSLPDFDSSFIKFDRFNETYDEFPIFDLGIHDIDLFYYKIHTNHQLVKIESNIDYYKIVFKNKNQMIVIQGGRGEKKRSITVGNTETNLLNGINYHQQIKDFIDGKKSNAKKAHLFLSNLYTLFHTF